MIVVIGATVAVWLFWPLGDDTSTSGAESSLAPPGVDPVFEGDGAEATIVATTPTIAAADALRIELLERQIAVLEGELRKAPPPAISGSRISRIPMDADVRFLSASDAGVAVVGGDGSYANIDPDTDEVTDVESLSASAARVLRTGTSVWVGDFGGDQLLRVDPAGAEVLSRFPIDGPDGLQKDGRTLIVAAARGGYVARVDSADGTILDRIDVGGSPTAVLVTAEGRIFAAVFDTAEVVELDRSVLSVIGRTSVGDGPVGLASGGEGIIFVSSQTAGTVSRVDLDSGEMIEVEVGAAPIELAISFGSLWVSVSESGDLVELDLDDLTILSRTPLGGTPTGLSVGADSLWVAVADDMVVVRIAR